MYRQGNIQYQIDDGACFKISAFINDHVLNKLAIMTRAKRGDKKQF